MNMKKGYIYFLVGALLTGLVFIVVQVSQASPTIPNPGHGTSALEGNASLNMNSNKIINLTTPTADTDASTKGYVDTKVASLTTLTCHTVECAFGASTSYQCTATCDTGTLTGGGIGGVNDGYDIGFSYPTGANSWFCLAWRTYGTCYARCCSVS